MTPTRRAWTAIGALAAILAITASWWALALWPVAAGGPEWILRTREVCFGATADGLPNAGGWLLLVGQPIGMIGVLAAVWGAELRLGFSLAMNRVAGQLAIGVTAALTVAGLWSVVGLVRAAGTETFSAGADYDIAAQLTRVDKAAPPLTLTDQWGQEVSLADYRGRAVVVTFAFAHCATVCPVIVSDAITAQQRLGDAPPAVLIVTLDPWRDTPSRLPAIAEQWRLHGDAHVLSGSVEDVERTLNAWRVPRVRNERTGDLTHPSVAYIVGPDGHINYVVGGSAETIAAAVKAI